MTPSVFKNDFPSFASFRTAEQSASDRIGAIYVSRTVRIDATAVSLPAGPWPPLDALERRVLGVLVEKQKTSKTADTYPMTLNALTTGSNQKSNRDPILNLSDDQVVEALARCQKKMLAIKITGSRVDRWRHNLYEVWRVDKVDLAVLAELLLRGPQTEGELRTRASRMDAIDDLEALRTVLKPLVQRNFVVYLTPEDRRGATLTHGFHDPRELEHLRARAVAQPTPVADVIGTAPVRPPERAASDRADTISRLEAGLAQVRDENAELKKQIADLQSGLEALQRELANLKESLRHEDSLADSYADFGQRSQSFNLLAHRPRCLRRLLTQSTLNLEPYHHRPRSRHRLGGAGSPCFHSVERKHTLNPRSAAGQQAKSVWPVPAVGWPPVTSYRPLSRISR